MKLSIVIVTHNRLEELCELLETIAGQSVKANEIVIVNDAGESVETVKALYNELPITILNLKENVKHVRARNEGVKQASGDVIMLFDDDDLMTPGHIERMLKALESSDFAYSDAEIVSFQDKNKTRYPVSRKLFAYTFDIEEMRKFSTYVPSGSVYKRSIHEKIGAFDPEMHNYWDWDFFLRVAKEGFTIKRVPTASVIYAFSDNGDNQSAELHGARENYLKALCEKHQLGDLPTKNFAVLLEEPAVKKRESASERVWDGEPVKSRLVDGQ
ncbi:glycosyltransferase family 2 protein [Bacillus gobiensis]|uniref:glycosyltransferase family 2 protein n=1 Tax=Bacillus gobiensis TaxID=1441095 RepID=UPI003D1EA2A3